uniref:RNA methylase family UPF0020, putative n=1 Tax=Theileria annulata TaxID=5874 RepID=A0A3B0MGD2_THEAN
MERCLFRMRMDVDYNELIEFELLSLADLLGVSSEDFKLSYYKDENITCKLYSQSLTEYYLNYSPGNPVSDFKRLETTDQNVFLFGSVPSIDIAKAIFDRSILNKEIINVWAECENYDEILDYVLNECKAEIESHLLGKSWCVKYSKYNNKSNSDDIIKVLDKLLPIFQHAGDVDLINPITKIAIIEKYNINKKTCEKKLDRIYFGNILFERNDSPWWTNYCLSNRPILGPTSLENSLSFILSNLGKVKSGNVVYDPFVGSGGSLISSSIFGGYCIGSDIDIRILRGWGISYIKSNTSESSNRASYMNNKLMKNINNNLRHKNCLELITFLLQIGLNVLVKHGRLIFLLPSHVNNIDESLSLVNCKGYKVVYVGQQLLTGGNRH